MREIKFRAWKKQQNGNYKMNYEPFVYDNECLGEFSMVNINKALANGGNAEYSEDNIFMQFTGLKDKNGKEIYEGDIAIFGSDPAEQIIFKDGAFRWGGDFDYILQICEEYNIEVIGNIYENPELLDK